MNRVSRQNTIASIRLSPLESAHYPSYGYSPLVESPLKISRRSSIATPSDYSDTPKNMSRITTSKVLQIVKDAQKQLNQIDAPLRKPRMITSESQEALNFTFAQQFSTKQILRREFQSKLLQRRFFA